MAGDPPAGGRASRLSGGRDTGLNRTSVGGLEPRARSASPSVASHGGSRGSWSQTRGAGPTWPAARRAVFTFCSRSTWCAALASHWPARQPEQSSSRGGGPLAPRASPERAGFPWALAGRLGRAPGWPLLSRSVLPGVAPAGSHAGLSLTPSGSGVTGGRERNRLAGGAEAERGAGSGGGASERCLPPAGRAGR